METSTDLQSAINYLFFSSHPAIISASLIVGVGLCLLLTVSIIKHENAAFKKHESTQQ
ncbi:hypothetical protein OR573_15515 [Halomonas sp. CH40]|jgi:hypothetical protein|uniref:hypothetical protein n=1 Tax=Halomonadaceae TaxID=28256 RepID=UPI000A97804C|nr:MULTISPECIES: hypothetical protein [Halomonas]MCO7243984.1 hypothetical protein [Halomonas sp. Ps84H-12]|tara:strand:- start:112 stop:285 length:174 start_codon:yes stop_codon:yes gene_type:complete